MESVTFDEKLQVVIVTFSGQIEVVTFALLWLRDNCQCRECFHPDSKARLFLLRNLDPDIQTDEVKLLSCGILEIIWEDGHMSKFTSEWLRERGFYGENKQCEKQLLELPTMLWDSKSMQDQIPSFDFNEVIKKRDTCFRWLSALEQRGISLIVEAPQAKDAVLQVCSTVAYPRKTAYGETFQVYSKHSPNNLAYTSSTLGLHTDQPYLQYMPGMQMLHCIKKASQGGENIFADGFLVARELEKKFPTEYKILCTTPVYYVDEGVQDGKAFHMRHKCFVLQFNGDGELARINYNNQVRDSVLGLPASACQRFYRALIRFESMLMDPQFRITYLLQPGEIVCFHNYRVLHGREQYTMTGSDERYLEGTYLDWDEIRSKRRVLSASNDN